MSHTDLDRPEVRIGRAGSDHVSIRILGRLHPDADDYWDGNWLMTPVEVVAGSFRGEVGASLRAEELRSFREGLEELNASLSGEAVLESMEKWLRLYIGVSGSGQLEVRGTTVDRPGVGNELRFQIHGLDQSDLPTIIEALREAETSFPVLGNPGVIR